MRCLDSITEIVKDRGAWSAAAHGDTKNCIQLRDEQQQQQEVLKNASLLAELLWAGLVAKNGGISALHMVMVGFSIRNETWYVQSTMNKKMLWGLELN